MKKYFTNLLSAVMGLQRVTILKGEVVSIRTLNDVLELLPNKPQAKVIAQETGNSLIEFRVEIPRKRMTRAEKRKAKKRRTWAGGRV